MEKTKPIIGITMGDGAGVGPEIIMKALNDQHIYEICAPFVIGDTRLLERAGKIVGNDAQLKLITSPDEAAFQYGVVEVVDLNLLPEDLSFGQISAEAGNAAFRYLERAIELANDGKLMRFVQHLLIKRPCIRGVIFTLGIRKFSRS